MKQYLIILFLFSFIFYFEVNTSNYETCNTNESIINTEISSNSISFIFLYKNVLFDFDNENKNVFIQFILKKTSKKEIFKSIFKIKNINSIVICILKNSLYQSDTSPPIFAI